MKKSLLALAALAALSLVFVSCGGGDDPAGSTNVTPAEPIVLTWSGEINLANNYTYGLPETSENYVNQQVVVDTFPSFKFEAGQKIKIEVTGTLEKAGEAIRINLIDNTAAANWWTELFGGIELIPAGTTEINNTVEFELEKAATAAGAAKLQVFSSDPEGVNPKLNVTLQVTIQ